MEIIVGGLVFGAFVYYGYKWIRKNKSSGGSGSGGGGGSGGDGTHPH